MEQSNRKRMLGAMAALCVSILGSLAGAFGSHGAQGTSDSEEACGICHTPVTAEPKVPLWNPSSGELSSSKTSVPAPADNGTVYKMYSSRSMDMTPEPTPGAESLLCLSCHDGTLAVYQTHKVGLGDKGTEPTAEDYFFGKGGMLDLGTDLSDDHPISFSYDPTRDHGFRPAVDGKVGDLPLYGENKDQVECTTCHEPHTSDGAGALRMSNSRSALCLTCHVK